tara:strand:+ start:5344 stop:5598 length:255 start_codon:yes stop_codon:yes gene_type:complete
MKQRREKIKKYLTITRIKRAISARVISTLVTVLVGWLVTGNPYIALSIGAVDTIVKLFLYYTHETLWEKKMTKDIKKIKKKYKK